jgi:hypothetical protein
MTAESNTDDHPSTSDAPLASGPPAGHRDTTAPERPTSRRLRVLAVVGPVVALLLAMFVPAGLLSLLPQMTDDSPAGAVVVVVVAQSLVVCAAAIALAALLLRWHGLRLRDCGFRWTRVSLPSLVAGLAVGAVVVLAVGLPLSRLGLLRAGEGWGLPWWALVVAGLAQAFALQGLPEELLFRGYQMTALRLRPVGSILISATVFGALHLISRGGQQGALERLYYLALPFGFAVAAGALMVVTDSLWASVGVHSGVHVGFLAGTFLGIGNGPQLWLLCGAVWTVVGVALLLVARRQGRLTRVWQGPQR